VWSTHCSIPQHPYLVLILPLRFPFQVPLLYVLVVGLLFLGGPVVTVLALTAQPCCWVLWLAGLVVSPVACLAGVEGVWTMAVLTHPLVVLLDVL
jgi:hypothetical protein